MHRSYTALRQGRFALLLLALYSLTWQPAGAQPLAPAPVLVSLTANDGLQAEIAPGWPLLVQAEVLHRDAFDPTATPVTLTASAGAWSGAVRVEIRDAQGAAVQWPLRLLTEAEGSLMLDAESGGRLVWYLSPEEIGALAAGAYTLRAVLDSTSYAAPGTARSARSAPVRVEVKADAQGTEGYVRLLKARYHALRGSTAEALAEVDALVQAEPGNVSALAFRGGLLSRSGALHEAVLAYNAAMNAFYAADPEATEPPFGIVQGQMAAIQALETDSVFTITVADKGLNHPYKGRGSALGYFIDGTPGEELNLVRGRTYTFDVQAATEQHPFYLTTDQAGAGAVPHTDGVVTTLVDGVPVLQFTPDETTPDLLYYQCISHAYMGWRLRVRNAMTGTSTATEEPDMFTDGFVLTAPAPNPFDAATRFDLTVAEPQRVTAAVYDLLGRQVAVLHDGLLAANSRRELTFYGAGHASGLYLIRIEGETFATTAKVLLVR